MAGFWLVAGASYADNGGKQPVKSFVEFNAIPGKLDAKHMRDLPAPVGDEVQALAAAGLSYL